MYRITCQPVDENLDEHYKINNVEDIILKDNFIMISFNLKELSSLYNLITFFKHGEYLFNIISTSRELNIKSFVGKYNKCSLIGQSIYMIFEKGNQDGIH